MFAMKRSTFVKTSSAVYFAFLSQSEVKGMAEQNKLSSTL